MRSAVKEAEDSGEKRDRKKRGMQRAAMWWESGMQEGRLGSALLGAPGKWAPDLRVLHAGLVAARSCRNTPSGWQGAQK